MIPISTSDYSVSSVVLLQSASEFGLDYTGIIIRVVMVMVVVVVLLEIFGGVYAVIGCAIGIET